MGDKFPYFYYDVVARIIPGGVFLALLWCLGVNLPGMPSAVAAAAESGVTGSPTVHVDYGLWEPVILSAIYLGLSYAIGVLFEAMMQLEPVNGLYNHHFINRMFAAALIKKTVWRRPIEEADAQLASWDIQTLRVLCHNWLMLQPRPGHDAGFAHAHRFQAESKMFLFLAVIGGVLAIGGLAAGLVEARTARWSSAMTLLGLVLPPLFVWLAFARERRRWESVLGALDELYSKDCKSDRSLVSACMAERSRRQAERSADVKVRSAVNKKGGSS